MTRPSRKRLPPTEETPSSSTSSSAVRAPAKRMLDFSSNEQNDGSGSGSGAGNNKNGPDHIVGDDASPPITSTTFGTGENTPTKKRRRGLDNFFSPPSKRTAPSSATTAVVTPEKQDSVTTTTTTPSVPLRPADKDGDGTGDGYVPVYIHKNLNYQRRGRASLSDTLASTFALVEQYYQLPSDLETNRTYGPLSGTCYEERAVEAYENGLLARKVGEGTFGAGAVVVNICSHCAVLGHGRNDCPELI